jgi:hypothetical protein
MSVLARLAFCLAIAFGTFSAQSARGTVTYAFTGDCIDCAAAASTASFPVAALLTLRDYRPGEALREDHFLSFSYAGSNLVTPFTISRENFLESTERRFEGSFNVAFATNFAAGSPEFQTAFVLRLLTPQARPPYRCTELGRQTLGSICAATQEFAFATGPSTPDWFLGLQPADYGATYAWRVAPEPSTELLLAVGLAGLAVASRRRKGRAARYCSETAGKLPMVSIQGAADRRQI